MLQSYEVSPSDALLDSTWVRSGLNQIHEFSPDAGELRILGGIPLPIVAIMAHTRATATDAPLPDAARADDVRALAKVVLTAGRAYAQRERGQTAPEDWPELLSFVREAIQQRAQLSDNAPWCRAATYVADQCESSLAGPGDAPVRSGAYGVLQQLATTGAPGRAPAAWVLHVESPV
ncbi:hypothetical protein [Streptomyces omiyaensis]|uniref:hypothetical protein n=1 Tax=Streptomyces omiyaensis TaxID=68247 RepID=UPI0036F7088A